MRFIESDVAMADVRLLMDIKRETANEILQESANDGAIVSNAIDLQKIDILQVTGVFLESGIAQDIKNLGNAN